jgi:hypothetical protein
MNTAQKAVMSIAVAVGMVVASSAAVAVSAAPSITASVVPDAYVVPAMVGGGDMHAGGGQLTVRGKAKPPKKPKKH